MRDKLDERLDALFRSVRLETPGTEELEPHFETRLMARLADRTSPYALWQLMAWRMVPAFALIAIVLLACSILLNQPGYSDPFAAIVNGREDQLARMYLIGE